VIGDIEGVLFRGRVVAGNPCFSGEYESKVIGANKY